MQIKNFDNLNAFSEVFNQEVVINAKRIDQKIRTKTAGKLAGLVVGVKDNLCYKNHISSTGSKFLKNFNSPYTCSAIQSLIDEDAIIIGRQNCDEFGMGSSSEHSAYGPTINGIGEKRVPGGSSGGSAVAVQKNMCHVSIASDTGGSVRQPASFCGVIGLKPTYSRISRYGLIAYASSFDCIGIIGRNPYEMALCLETMAGEDINDSTSSKVSIGGLTSSLEFIAQRTPQFTT